MWIFLFDLITGNILKHKSYAMSINMVNDLPNKWLVPPVYLHLFLFLFLCLVHRDPSRFTEINDKSPCIWTCISNKALCFFLFSKSTSIEICRNKWLVPPPYYVHCTCISILISVFSTSRSRRRFCRRSASSRRRRRSSSAPRSSATRWQTQRPSSPGKI